MFVLGPIKLPMLVENIVDPVLLSLIVTYPFWRIALREMSLRDKQFIDLFGAEKNSFLQQIEGLNKAAVVAITDIDGNIIFANNSASGQQVEKMIHIRAKKLVQVLKYR